MYQFFSGTIMMGCVVVSLFFLRFWRKTGDPLFRTFAIAFAALGIERFVPQLIRMEEGPQAYLYLIRLGAFLLLLIGIIQKNLGAGQQSSRS